MTTPTSNRGMFPWEHTIWCPRHSWTEADGPNGFCKSCKIDGRAYNTVELLRWRLWEAFGERREMPGTIILAMNIDECVCRYLLDSARGGLYVFQYCGAAPPDISMPELWEDSEPNAYMRLAESWMEESKKNWSQL